MNVKRYNESLKLNEINDLSEILSYKLNNIKISKDEITKINRFLIKNSFNLEAKSLLNFVWHQLNCEKIQNLFLLDH